jgi:septation ring formation regulator EzrA
MLMNSQGQSGSQGSEFRVTTEERDRVSSQMIFQSRYLELRDIIVNMQLYGERISSLESVLSEVYEFTQYEMLYSPG